MSAWDLPRTRARDQLPEAIGTGVEAAMQCGVEQVRVQGSVEPVAQPRRFVGSAGAEHEGAPIQDSEKRTCKFHFESKNGTSDSVLRVARNRGSTSACGARERSAASAVPGAAAPTRYQRPYSTTVRVQSHATPSAGVTGAG